MHPNGPRQTSHSPHGGTNTQGGTDVEMDSSLCSEAGDIVHRMEVKAVPPRDCLSNLVNLLLRYGTKSLVAPGGGGGGNDCGGNSEQQQWRDCVCRSHDQCTLTTSCLAAGSNFPKLGHHQGQRRQ